MAQNTRYLIVDDDKANNMLCKVIINKIIDNADVHCYEAPREALNYIKCCNDSKEALLKTTIFLDINMPDLTGWEFLEEFKDFSEEVKNNFTIYMLSSSVDYKDKNQAKENPLVEGYIEKPLTRAKVSELLG